MLLNLITSQPQKKELPPKPPSDSVANNIIKAIEKPAPKPKLVSVTPKSSLFDMFHEKQEDTNKSLRGDQLLAKVLSKKRDPDGQKAIKALMSGKQHHGHNNSNNGERKSSHKPKVREYELNEENEKKVLKMPKKEEIPLKQVSKAYLDAMSQVGDLNSLFNLDDGQIARLAGHLKKGLGKKKEDEGKVKDLNKAEELVLKKLTLKDKEEDMPNVIKIKKYDPTAFKVDLNKGKPMKNIENVAIKKNIDSNKKSYDPLANDNNKEKKAPALTNNKDNIRPNNINNNIKKQYNPLDISNNPKGNISLNMSNKNPRKENFSLKRNLRDLYSDEDHEEPEEENSSFIDDDVEAPENFDYRLEVRKITGYNPKKYRKNEDYDDAAMEVGFNEIEKEEKVASLIARREDENEWKYIQQEKLKEERKKKK